MLMQAQIHAAVAMAQQQPEQQRLHQQEIFLQQQLSGDQLQRWGSLTSVTSTSSSDWNDIGLPPLPLRQRSISSPADAPVPLIGNVAALHQHQQQQYLLACSMPEQQQYLLEQQHSLQTCLSMGDSGSLEALVYDAGLRHGMPQSAADQDAQMLEGDTQQPGAWNTTLSPSVLATAAAFARARRSQQALSTLHSSGSMSSTTSGSSSSSSCSQPLATQSSGRSERSFSYPGGGSSTAAMDVCSSERSLPRMDSTLLRCQSVATAASPKHQPETAARLSAQELAVLSKLKAILSEKEQLAGIEKQLRYKLLDEQVSRAVAAAGGSPRAAAAATMKQASALLHHQQQQQRSHSFSGGCSMQSPQPRGHLHTSPSVGSPAAAAASAGGSPRSSSSRHQHSSTAAALLAAAADPVLVLEYARAHKQQQQQHQACMAGVAAATSAGSPRACALVGSQQKHAARKQGLNPAAMAKLRQLMVLQQQQIQVQQELLALL